MPAEPEVAAAGTVVELPFGKGTLPLALPAGALVLRLPPAVPLRQPRRALAAALDQPLGTPPLAELAAGRRRACIVICDITRPVPNRLLLPGLLSRLEGAGLPASRIHILIATGTHRPATPGEIIHLVGRTIARRYQVHNHRCQEADACELVGTTSRGIPVQVNRRYREADLRILTGFIEPHLMAGWSGGRKAICPGICSLQTIKGVHAPELLAHRLATNGSLDGNPVHEQLLEAARLAGADFIVNVTLDAQRRPTGIFAGDLDQAHRAGVAQARGECQVSLPWQADVVVTSCGGYPLDATLYQGAKGLAAALPVLRPGGCVVMAASCQEGIGSEDFRRALRQYTPEEFKWRLREPGFYLFEQWQLQAICQAALRARLFLVTTRNAELAEAQGNGWLAACDHIEEALARARRVAGGGRLAVMPAGPYLLPRCQPRL